MGEQGPQVSGRWFASMVVALFLVNLGSIMAISHEGTETGAAFNWMIYIGIALLYTALVVPFVSAVAGGGPGQHITTGIQRGNSRYKTICTNYLLDHNGKIPAHKSFLTNAGV
jgi:hypothetical protein